MKTYQGKELEARAKLSNALSEKGKKLIWGVTRHYVSGDKTVFDFKSQEYLFSLSFSVNN